jgi:hypothetical protein
MRNGWLLFASTYFSAPKEEGGISVQSTEAHAGKGRCVSQAGSYSTEAVYALDRGDKAARPS